MATTALAAADQVLDDAEAALSLARGRIAHARFLAQRQDDPAELALLERAAALYHQLGDVRGEGEAVRGGAAAGVPPPCRRGSAPWTNDPI
jgi:hypothetical protein